MPKKYSGMEVGGVEFQFSATELKLLNKYVAELTKVKTLRQGIVLTYKRQQELAKKDLEAGKQDTKAAIQRKEVLTDIVKIMNDTRKFRQALQKTIPKIEEKAVKEGKKHATVLDLIKKKYAWQLLYFTALATVIAMTLGNSKVLGHFFDIIGSALGFVLDMLLISLIPAVVWLVTKLFELGGWFAGFPDWLKIATLALVTFFGTAGALIFYGILKDIVARIVAIGAEAGISKIAVDALSSAWGGIGAKTVWLTIKIAGAELLYSLMSFLARFVPSLAAQYAPAVAAMVNTPGFGTPEYMEQADVGKQISKAGGAFSGGGLGVLGGGQPINLNVFFDGRKADAAWLREQGMRLNVTQG